MAVFRQSNTPLDLATSRQMIGDVLQAIQRLEPQDELQARLRASMLTAAKMIEAHHAAAAWIESMITRLWGHLDGLQSTFQTFQERSEIERQGEGR